MDESRENVAETRQGVVIVVQGVGGLDRVAFSLRRVFAKERMPYELSVFDWSHGFGRWFADLTDVRHRDAEAARLAEFIEAYHAQHRDRVIQIVAKSAGTGIAILALERVGAEIVRNVVMLGPALSPKYDLTAGLRAVGGEMVVFWSSLDVIILGAGTRLFGTIDRVRSVGAGLVGFDVAGADVANAETLRQYAKLRQIRWELAMSRTGNFGGHWGLDSPVFLRKFVVPVLRSATPRVC